MKEKKWYKTTVEISFQDGDRGGEDFADEEEALNWLCSDNVAYCLRSVCKNTNFKVKKVD